IVRSSTAEPSGSLRHGDLWRRLRPDPASCGAGALQSLAHQGVARFALIGVDLAQATAESWRDHLYETLKSFVGNAPRNSTWTGSTRLPGSGSRFAACCSACRRRLDLELA